jgi:exopolyphosphatase/guanosine-5'-triphosphate,3'-diphosphate pyrophosphatase
VISGEEESRLAYLAAESGLGVAPGSLVVFDTGGGSTQFTFGKAGVVEDGSVSTVGAVRLTERFGLDGPVSEQTLAEALGAIGTELETLDGRATPDAIVGMGGCRHEHGGGEARLAKYDPEVVQGTELDRAEIERQIELYRTRAAAARREIVGLQPARAEVILAGACVVLTVLRKLGRDSFTVSDRGLRHGVLVERFGH